MRLLLLLATGFLLYISWPTLEEKLDYFNLSSEQQQQADTESEYSETKGFADSVDQLSNGLDQLKLFLTDTFEKLDPKSEASPPAPADKPELTAPDSQPFSVGNIELGMTAEEVESQLGSPNRESANEYGTSWHAFHDNYNHFMMVAYDTHGEVAAMYTNHDLISSDNGIRYGSSMDEVRGTLGAGLDQIKKGLTIYKLNKDREYDLYLIDGSYISIFYDKHQGNTVTAIQIVSEDFENNKSDFYTEPDPELKQGFELQLFDLTNAARTKHGLKPLEWDGDIQVTARKHSTDMAENDYFSHTNPEGESPFDRMAEDNIRFSVAGENLAYGQSSSIFAHEGLMNSLGHRENILKAEYRRLGIGVDFNEKNQPYYTQNYYTGR